MSKIYIISRSVDGKTPLMELNSHIEKESWAESKNPGKLEYFNPAAL